MTPIEHVLDLARWAPSGDNTQPWRFEIVDERSCIVHGFDTRRHCVYDLTGASSQIAVGAMLETARIAATALKMRAEIERLESDEEHPRFDLRLHADSSVRPHPLIPFITTRCTNRRPYSRRALTSAEKGALEESVGPSYTLLWLDAEKRTELAKILYASALIRLTIPEAYEVHRSVIEWRAQFSDTKIPDEAVGLDPIGMALMRWVMKSWRRTYFVGRYLGGTILPRIQLDVLPGLYCAAHVLILAGRPPEGIDDYVHAGGAVQRFWLTAAKLGLQHQPELTPLIFAGYSQNGVSFSADTKAHRIASRVCHRFGSLTSESKLARAVWLGRIGESPPPLSRSLRMSVTSLLLPARDTLHQTRDSWLVARADSDPC